MAGNILYLWPFFFIDFVNISSYKALFCNFFFSKNDREIEPVVLHTINPQNSSKWVTTFSWIFYFSLIYFSKNIFEFFFSQMPDSYGGMWNYVQGKFTASFADCQDQSETIVADKFSLCQKLGGDVETLQLRRNCKTFSISTQSTSFSQ